MVLSNHDVEMPVQTWRKHERRSWPTGQLADFSSGLDYEPEGRVFESLRAHHVTYVPQLVDAQAYPFVSFWQAAQQLASELTGELMITEIRHYPNWPPGAPPL